LDLIDLFFREIIAVLKMASRACKASCNKGSDLVFAAHLPDTLQQARQAVDKMSA
jgi:hypothetical protein